MKKRRRRERSSDRHIVKNPCAHCRKNHTRCSISRPCERCVKRGVLCYTSRQVDTGNINESVLRNLRTGPTGAVDSSSDPVEHHYSSTASSSEKDNANSGIPSSKVELALSSCVNALESAIRFVEGSPDKVDTDGVKEISLESMECKNEKPNDSNLLLACKVVFSSSEFKMWSDMVESPNTGLVCFLAGGECVYVGETIAKQLEYSVSELLEVNVIRLLALSEVNTSLHNFYKSIMDVNAKGYEFGSYFRKKNGGLLYMHRNVRTVRLCDQQPFLLVAFVFIPDCREDSPSSLE